MLREKMGKEEWRLANQATMMHDDDEATLETLQATQAEITKINMETLKVTS